MTSPRVVFVAALIVSVRVAPAWAGEEPADQPAPSPAGVPGEVSVSAPEEQPLPPPGAPATPAVAPPPAAPAPAVPPPDPEPPGSHPSAEDKWPIEWVLRPLTLPAGMSSFSASFNGQFPKNYFNVDPVTGTPYTFNSDVAVGLGLTLGLTDDFQIGFGMPRLLCFATATPSGCDGVNAYAGTGGSVRFLALRQNGFQIAPHAGVSVARTSPTVLRWSAGSAFKYTVSERIAFFSSPTVARNFNSAPSRPANPWLAYLPAELEVQAAPPLLLYAVVEPWGSIGDVSRGILLEVYGGVSFTFGRLGEIGLEGGTFNVLAQPSWNSNVPEWFAELSLTLWRY